MTFKEKVSACARICGTHINMSDPSIAEFESMLGFDYLWVDMEHTRLTVDQVHAHLMAARYGGTPMIVRVPVSDLTNTKRILELGVDGIVFPMVESAAHAKELLDWTLYPPIGTRGCGPKGAVNYGLSSEPHYYKEGHLEMCRFVMIEKTTAVDEIEKIAALPYLDGCVMGFHDLSGSVGELGNIFGEKNLEVAKRAINAFRSAGKSVAISTFASDEETLRRYHDLGINMITTGADYDYIIKGAQKNLELIRSIQRGE